MMTYMARLNVMKMDCMVVICFSLQILLTIALEGTHGYQVRFVIPPSCRSGFMLMDPEHKIILQLSSLHSGITVSNGCYDNSDPGGCVVKGTVSTPGVYWVQPTNVTNFDCYKTFNITGERTRWPFRSSGTQGFEVRFDIPPSCRSGFVLRNPGRKIIAPLPYSSYSAGITVSNGCHDNSDPGGCVVKGTVSTLGVYRVRPTDVSNFGCYKTFNVSEEAPEYVGTMETNHSDISMVTKVYSNVEVNTTVTEQDKRVPDSIATTNSPDIAMVTKDYHNVEVNTAVTEQGKRDTDSIATTNSPDIAMVTTGFSFVEVYTKLTERDNDDLHSFNDVVAIVAPIVSILVAVIFAIASFAFIRKFKRKRKRRDIQPEDPPTTNNLHNRINDPVDNSINAEIDDCVMSDEAHTYDYVTNNDLQAKPTTSSDYITPVSCNYNDLKTQAATSDDCYLVPLNKRNPVFEALGDNASDEYTSTDQHNMSMYQNRNIFNKKHFQS